MRKLNAHQSIVEVHGFCDASQRAFGACIYLRTKVGLNDHHSELLCSRSCVAPLKTVSLPIRAISRLAMRLAIGALNQQGQRVIGTLEMPDLSLVGLDDRVKLDNLPLATMVSFCGK